MDEHKSKGSHSKNETVTAADANSVSSVFSSPYSTPMAPLENQKIAGILENFVVLFQRSVSNFLGKKMAFQFENIQLVTPNELQIEEKGFILSSIRFVPHQQLGLVFFDYAFIHSVIDILFGAGSVKSEAIIQSLGKSGVAIAKKVAELAVNALQSAISEYDTIQISLLKTTEQQGLILNQPLPNQFYSCRFHAELNDQRGLFQMAIPGDFFDDMMAEETVMPIENKAPSTVNNTLKKDIIDSTITVVASLQDITLKITDIMNLKAGDLIPIFDPTLVYLSHNQKNFFKGSVGQSNALRVVTIVDAI